MSIKEFIPTIWSANLQRNLEKVQVFASLANRDYEGEIKNGGERVKIVSIGNITTNAYTTYATLTAENVEGSGMFLNIDQKKYISFYIDDVDKAQSKDGQIWMQRAMEEAAYSLRDTQDAYIAGLHADCGIYVANSGSAYAVNSDNVNEVITLVQEAMDTNNVPYEGRFMVIPPWFHSKMVLAGLAQLGGLTDEANLYKNGLVARALGFDFYISNNLKESSSKTTVKLIAGVKGKSIAVAEQILKMEAVRPADKFADRINGLHVYGCSIARPDMTARLLASYAAEA